MNPLTTPLVNRLQAPPWMPAGLQALGQKLPPRMHFLAPMLQKMWTGGLTAAKAAAAGAKESNIRYFLRGNSTKFLDAALIGSVITVMAITVQPYVTAPMVKSLSKLFELVGLQAPTLWRNQALDANFRIVRDTFLWMYNGAAQVRRQITDEEYRIINLEMNLKGKANVLQPAEVEHASALLEDLRRNITNVLRDMLVSWYHRVEFRKLNNIALYYHRFGIRAIPNADNPQRYVVYAQVGLKTYRAAASIAELEGMKSIPMMPNLELPSETATRQQEEGN